MNAWAQFAFPGKDRLNSLMCDRSIPALGRPRNAWGVLVRLDSIYPNLDVANTVVYCLLHFMRFNAHRGLVTRTDELSWV